MKLSPIKLSLPFILISLLFSSCAGIMHSTNSNSPAKNTSKEKQNSSTVITETFTGTNSRLIGRFDRSTHGEAKFTWPGSAIEFIFDGTKASINIASEQRTRFIVTVDGNSQNLWTETGNNTYLLASNIPRAVHKVRLTRANESTAGVTRFTSDPQVDGRLLSPPQAPQKKLLVIGDSITAGYGVEGIDEKCHYTLDTSNQQLTYAALAANALGADLHSLAWSGIGAWRSYGEKTPSNPTIIIRANRTLANDAGSKWDASQYVPDAILINIGTNDYWDGAATDDYRLGMANLLSNIQRDYPGKPIYLIASPMLTNGVHDAQKIVLATFVKNNVKLIDLGIINKTEGYGCDYHPNIITHQRLGNRLTTILKSDFNW